MKIKLHIGAHKTATTYMQRLLETNRSLLLKEKIHLSIHSNPRKTWMYDLLSCADEEKKNSDISSIINEKPEEGLWLISDEDISGTSYQLKLFPHIYPKLQKRLSCFKNIFPNDIIEIYFSIRSYENYYRSTYLEVVRNKGYMPFTDYYNEEHYKDNSWVKVIEQMVSVIPESQITLWCYEDFSQLLPVILSKFTETNLVNEVMRNYPPETLTRPSLSSTAIDILSKMDKLDNKILERKRIETIIEKYPLNKDNPPFVAFDEEIRRKFQNQYRQDIQVIKSKFPSITFLQ